MRTRSGRQRWFAGVSLLVAVVVLMVACGGAAEAPVADGKTLLEERCVQCHDLERTTSQSKTRDAWLVTVERMVNQGAELTDAEVEVLVDYLAEEYGP